MGGTANLATFKLAQENNKKYPNHTYYVYLIEQNFCEELMLENGAG